MFQAIHLEASRFNIMSGLIINEKREAWGSNASSNPRDHIVGKHFNKRGKNSIPQNSIISFLHIHLYNYPTKPYSSLD